MAALTAAIACGTKQGNPPDGHANPPPDAPLAQPDASHVDAGPIDAHPIDAAPPDASKPDAFVQIDARPAGTVPPTVYGTFSGGGSMGTTTTPGAGRAVITIGQGIVGDGKSGTTGSNTSEWGLLPGVKVH